MPSHASERKTLMIVLNHSIGQKLLILVVMAIRRRNQTQLKYTF